MHRVSYAGEKFLVADAAIVALLDFAIVIADAGQAQPIVIPTVTDDGRPSLVRSTIGPASQIVAVPIDDGANDPDVDDFVEEISDRAKRYMRGRGIPEEITDRVLHEDYPE
ncbi:hypothetical protein [Herbiconiux sp.]|uniref:hypothetical protein n=1 Tax=Herbiconiux sp. TaxID=1871186 RepID=UPI0025C37D66|nr:hypothetical protein [Herbiconiux sp.]